MGSCKSFAVIPEPNKSEVLPVSASNENKTTTNAVDEDGHVVLLSGLKFMDDIQQDRTVDKLFAAVKRGMVLSNNEREDDDYINLIFIILGDLPAVETIFNDNNQEQDIFNIRMLESLGMWSSTPLIVAVQYGHENIADFFMQVYEKSFEKFRRTQTSNVNVISHRNEKGASAILYAVIEGIMIFYLLNIHIY